jgi:autotransporter-associated beta strand protein/T5SS/PEP-CTERM-associated repeat protein
MAMTDVRRRRPADRGAAVRLSLALVIAVLSARASTAQVLLYNYLQNSTASFTGSGYPYNAFDFQDNREKLAERFVTQAGGNVVTEVKVNLWTELSNPGTFTVSLYSDNANSVGTRVATVGTGSLSTIYSAAPGTLTPTTFGGLSLGLTPTTSYWIVVENDSGVVGSGMYWGFGGTGSSAYVAPNPTSAARFNAYTTPQWSNVTVPALGMQVTAVAEPAPGNVTWNVSSGNWNVGGNWSGALTPFSSGTAIIDGGRTVLLGSGVVGTAATAIFANASTGTMRLSGGQLTATTSIVGANQGSNGAVSISSGTWSTSGDLELGSSGTGTLAVSGGRVTNVGGFLGRNAGSRGIATVTGGTWATTGDLAIGGAGTGSLSMSGGSVTSGSGLLGTAAGSDGTATISGGTWAIGGNATVGGTGSGTLTVSGSGAVRVNGGTGSLALASAAGSVGTLNLGAGGAVGTLATSAISGGAGAATVNFNHTGAMTFTTPLSGTLTVRQSGSGNTVLSGNNTYSGTTSVTAAFLQADANARLGSSSLVIDGGGFRFGSAFNDLRAIALGASGGTIDTNGFSVSYASAITGSGGLTKTGLGTLTLSASTSYRGGTTVKTGTLAVATGGAISHAAAATTIASGSGDSASLVIAGGMVTGSSATVGSGTGASGAVTVTSGTWSNGGGLTLGAFGSGTMLLGGGSVTSASGTLGNAAGASGAVTITGGTWANSGNLDVGSGGNGTLGVTGSGAVTVGGGSGTVTLARYVGATGTLNIGTGGAAGTLAAAVVTGSRAGSTVNFNHTGDTTLAASLIGTLTITKAGPGTATLSGTNTYAGTTTVSAGLVQIDANSRLGSSTLTLAGGGIRFGAAFNDLRDATLSGSGGTFDTNGFAISYGSALSGGGALTKTGLGSLTVTGTKSYSGGTTVTQGTLVAGTRGAFGEGAITVGEGGTLDLGGYLFSNSITNNGGSVINADGYVGTQSVTGVVSMTGTVGGTVDVVAGGVLRGNQTVFNGLVSLATGANHSPGASPGTQTFGFGLSYDAGSMLTWELIANSGTGAGTTYDFLSVTGGGLSIATGATMDLVFDGAGSAVDWTSSFWNSGRSWTVIDVSGSATSTGDFVLGTIGNDALGQSLTSVRPLASFELDQSGGDVIVTYVVPEPSACTSAILGLAFGWRVLVRLRGRRYGIHG